MEVSPVQAALTNTPERQALRKKMELEKKRRTGATVTSKKVCSTQSKTGVVSAHSREEKGSAASSRQTGDTRDQSPEYAKNPKPGSRKVCSQVTESEQIDNLRKLTPQRLTVSKMPLSLVNGSFQKGCLRRELSQILGSQCTSERLPSPWATGCPEGEVE